MKPAFNILPEPSDRNGLNMLIEAGNYGISFTWFTRSPHAIVGIQVYNFDSKLFPSEWTALLHKIYDEQEIFRSAFREVCLCVDFPESIFIPGEMYDKATATDLLEKSWQTDPDDTICTDILKDQKLFNVYALNSEIETFFRSRYSKLNISHSSSLELPVLSQSNALTCIIYHNSIKVFAYENGAFLYTGYCAYAKPVDAAYFLLNICESYRLSPNTIPLRICGMIDVYSSLYNELYKYFMHVEFLPAKDGVEFHERIKFYPPHFLSHQTMLTTCAS